MSEPDKSNDKERWRFVLDQSLDTYSEAVDRLKHKEITIFVFTFLSLFAATGITSEANLKIPVLDVKVAKEVASQYLLIGAAAAMILHSIDLLNTKLLEAKIYKVFDRLFSNTHELGLMLPTTYLAFGNRLKRAGGVGWLLYLLFDLAFFSIPVLVALWLQVRAMRKSILSGYVIIITLVSMLSVFFVETYFTSSRVARWLEKYEPEK
jgi:hypothetical protein